MARIPALTHLITKLDEDASGAREAPQCALRGFGALVQAVELEALYRGTQRVWSEAGLTDVPTDRADWLALITTGDEPQERCLRCGSIGWSWSTFVDCSECEVAS